MLIVIIQMLRTWEKYDYCFCIINRNVSNVKGQSPFHASVTDDDMFVYTEDDVHIDYDIEAM